MRNYALGVHFITVTLQRKNAAYAEMGGVLKLLINLDVTIKMIECKCMCKKHLYVAKKKCFLFSCFITGEEAWKGYFFVETGL